jgi:hypothetical protein
MYNTNELNPFEKLVEMPASTDDFICQSLGCAEAVDAGDPFMYRVTADDMENKRFVKNSLHCMKCAAIARANGMDVFVKGSSTTAPAFDPTGGKRDPADIVPI